MSEPKMRVGVFMGGQSGEHEVSLMSARSVLANLDPARYAVTQIGITHEGAWVTGADVIGFLEQGRAAELRPAMLLPDPTRRGLFGWDAAGHWEKLVDLDVVFPVLHGTFGEDGTLQGLFELANLPYVGAGVLGAALGMDKGVFKDVMRAQGIPVVDWIIVTRREIEGDVAAVAARAEAVGAYPLYVKPANLGSSVGVTCCQGRGDLVEGLLDAARFDRRILIEKGVNAREIEVSVLGNDEPEASMPGEILPSRAFYSYEAKYLDGTSGLLIPAPLDAALSARVRALALQAFRAIDGTGLARVDFLLDRDSGQIYLNEVNTMPGFTTISMYPKLWEAAGLPYPRLLDRMIDLAVARQREKDRTERRYRREES
jgi:D-alanine-D-alanine ligase